MPSLVASGNVQDVVEQSIIHFLEPDCRSRRRQVELTDATTGALTYTPPSASFFGLVQVTYTVTDGAKNTATGNVIINVEQTIQPQDDGPIVAVAGKPLTISAVDLLGNDVAAPNGLKLSIGSVGNATNGTVVLNSEWLGHVHADRRGRCQLYLHRHRRR